jgi:RNA polymerase sigma factor for flagellar operon FliA
VSSTSNGHDQYLENNSHELDGAIKKHASLVKRIAHHMVGRMPPSVQVDDLIQAGMMGLLEALKNYDQSKGASFETYAGIRIRGSMIDEIRRGDWAPRSVHRNSRMVAKAIHELENKTGRDARDEEVAQYLSITMDEYHKILQDSAGAKVFGLEDVAAGEEFFSEEMHNVFVNPFEGVQNSKFKEHLGHSVSNLPERERLVLALYYDEELNLREVGEVLGVSESRVSQIHGQAMLRLQVRMKDWKLGCDE